MTEGDRLRAEISLLYEQLLRRAPAEAEMERWTARARQRAMSFRDLFDAVVATPEYKARNRVVPGHPVGHYYSPVVDPEELEGHFAPDRRRPIESLAGLDITEADVRATFEALRPFIGTHHFPEHKREGERYFADNKIYPLGDAIILSAMLQLKRPAQVIEIGSGFSTACMLDTIGRAGLDTRITCIEPYAERLRSTLTADDERRLSIVEEPVQTSDPALYETLGPGDILFIDSTHVLKTGSDVCFELFEILPRLAPGVMVHFHDIHYPFEYADAWIFDRRYSWNEVYAVRAFLMYNRRFRTRYFNHYFGNLHRAELESAYGARVTNPGGGLWIQVVDERDG